VICREGCGTGQGSGQTPGEAHESALKEAETDAMKRALMTFGNPFGLALYDRERKGVRGATNAKAPRPVSWVLLSPEGEALGVHADPVATCTALRREIEGLSDPERLVALWRRNLATLEMLQVNLPELRTDKGEHYGAILRALYQRRLRELKETKPAGQVAAEASPAPESSPHKDQATSQGPQAKRLPAQPGKIDKAALAIDAPRRVRDKEHLKFVRDQPCLICGRSPSQAHHLRFAQPRALGHKVSDKWVVPLCALHHQSLHTMGDERTWWRHKGIDPVARAEKLWGEKLWGETAVPA